MFRPAPRASGYFRTGYAQDLALLQTRLERVALLLFVLALAAVSRSSPRRSSSISPARCFSPSIGALSLMLLTGYAGQISLGHAGLAGRRRLHRRHPVPRSSTRRSGSRCRPPRWSAACSASSSACRRCACAGFISRSARSRCISSSSISAANTRPSAASRPASWSTRRASAAIKLTDGRVWYFVLLAAAAADAADLRQPAAQPHRPRLARDPRARDRRRSARHRHRALQAARLRHLVGA